MKVAEGVSAERIAGWAAAALGLSIPITTAGDNILLGLIALCAIVAGLRQRTNFAEIWRTPPIAVAGLLFALLLLACFHGEAQLATAFRALGKYIDLLLCVLIAWAATHPRTRRLALILFAIAAVANLWVSYSAALGLPGLRKPHYPIGFKASVTHSLTVSLAALLFLLWARDLRTRKWRWICAGLAVVCIHNVLFITIGRTGYVVLGLFLAYYATTFFRGWRGPAVAAVLLAALIPTVYLASPSLQVRVNEIASDIEQWQPDRRDTTSVGQRLEYYRTTARLIAEEPMTGVGTGAFPQAYARLVEPIGGLRTVNPHNDYLLLGAQAGVLAPVLLLLLYGLLWRYSARLETPLHRDLARGLAMAFAVGSLFNSFLLDHTEGLLLAWLTAVLYAGYRRHPPAAIPAS